MTVVEVCNDEENALLHFIIWQVTKYREICIKYNQYLKKLYFHM